MRWPSSIRRIWWPPYLTGGIHEISAARKTGFTISEISLGTVEIGMPYGIPENGNFLAPDETSAVRLLNDALDRGINFIDTARAYGESEAIIGRALHNRRQEYVLASKVLSRRGQNLQSERCAHSRRFR